jgi:hypothetical protein
MMLENIAIAGRPPGGTNGGGPYDDFGYTGQVTLAPGQQITVQQTRAFTAADPIGAWYAFATYETMDGVWHDSQQDAPFNVDVPAATATNTPVAPTTTPVPPTSTATPVPPTSTATALSSPTLPSGSSSVLWPAYYHTFGATGIGQTIPSNPSNVSELAIAHNLGLTYSQVDYTTDASWVTGLHQYHMTYNDYTPWRYIYPAMHHSCPNISPSNFSAPANACTMSVADQNTLYSEVQAHLDTVKNNPDITGFWLLDDWYGNLLPELEHIHALVAAANAQYGVKRPTVCGFSATLDFKGSPTDPTFSHTAHAWFDRAITNYSPQACDIVAPYAYAALPYPDTTGADWAMTNLMPYMVAQFKARGWDPATSYMVVITQAYSDSANQPGWHIPLPTAAEVETQVAAACKGGAVGVMPFDWDYKQDGTLRLYNTPSLQDGYAAGIRDCRAYWTGQP